MVKFGKALGRVRLPSDPLFRLLIVNGLAGLAVAALVLSGIFLANIGNLRSLVFSSDEPLVPIVMLAAGFAVTLGSVVIGSAIMLLGEKRPGGGTRRPIGRPVPDRQLQAVRVAAVSRPRQLSRR